MKKFTKVILIMTLVMGILGGILFAAGIAMGASVDQFPVNVRDAWEKHAYEWEDIEDVSGTDGSFEAEKVENLSVEAAAGSVEIRMVSEDDKIRISGLHESDEIEYREEEKELCIVRAMHGNRKERTLVIEIPEKKEFQKLDLGVEAGDLKVSGLLKADSCSLSADVGNLETEIIDCLESDLECNVGNLQTVFAGTQNDYEIHAKCDAGNLKIGKKSCLGWQHDDEHWHDEEYRHDGEHRQKVSSRKMNAECSLGNLVVSFNEK